MQNPSALQEFISAADSERPFPLKALLQMYSKDKERGYLYVNYFRGFKLLVDWLSPISYPLIPELRVPDVFNTYELNQLTDILRVPHSTIYLILIEIYYGSTAKNSILQQLSNSAFVRKEIPTI